MVQKIKFYNGGRYLEITQNGVTIYFDTLTSSTLTPAQVAALTLSPDVVSTITCATTGDDNCFGNDCLPNALLANNGDCLESNMGADLVGNA
jgi:hypothetical protein